MKEDNEEQIAALLRLAGPRPRIDDERTARVRAQVHDEWLRGVRQRTRVRWLGAAVAAAAMIAAVMLFIPRQRPAPAAAPSTIVAHVQTILGTTKPPVAMAATVAEGTWIETLAGSALSLDWNGATLRLGEQTKVRLDSARNATLERGTIYFDGHQSNVIIRTALGEIRDIGTQFEVRLRAETLRVRVREGRVDLRRGGESFIADAATELVAGPTSVRKNAIAVSGAEWQWIEEAAPPLRLEGLTLHEALTRVAREKGLRVELRGVDGDVRLHGGVAFTPDEALDAATAATSLSWRIENDTLIVSGRR